MILAAGLSRRMGIANKLLIPDGAGRPMLALVAASVCASQAAGVTVVLGHQAASVRAMLVRAVPSPKLGVVTAALYRAGLSASLGAGIAALPAGAAAVLVCLGDMPLVTTATLDTLIDAYCAETRPGIVVPVHAGQRGNPVLWDRRYFPALMALAGDSGGRALLHRHAEAVTAITLDDAGVLADFDTPEAFAALR